MTTRCGRFQSLGLAVVLALGAGSVWALLGIIVFGSLRTAFQPVNVYSPGESLLITRDGTPIIQSVDGISGLKSFRTLDGKPYDKPFHTADEMGTLAGPISSSERLQVMMWQERIMQLANSDGITWFFVHNGELQGRGYFVGYDNKSRLEVGYLGRNGFNRDEPPIDEQFPVNGRRASYRRAFCYPNTQDEQNGVLNPAKTTAYFFYLLADDGLMRINLSDRTAKFMLKDATIISATGSC